MTDLHKHRMQAGNDVMTMLDAIDDETHALLGTAAAALQAVAQQFRDKGVSKRMIAQSLCGMAVAAALETKSKRLGQP